CLSIRCTGKQKVGGLQRAPAETGERAAQRRSCRRVHGWAGEPRGKNLRGNGAASRVGAGRFGGPPPPDARTCEAGLPASCEGGIQRILRAGRIGRREFAEPQRIGKIGESGQLLRERKRLVPFG